jgi:hypothetical protein
MVLSHQFEFGFMWYKEEKNTFEITPSHKREKMRVEAKKKRTAADIFAGRERVHKEFGKKRSV